MNEFYYNKFDKTALLTTKGKMRILQEQKKVVVGYLDGFIHFPMSKMGI